MKTIHQRLTECLKAIRHERDVVITSVDASWITTIPVDCEVTAHLDSIAICDAMVIDPDNGSD